MNYDLFIPSAVVESRSPAVQQLRSVDSTVVARPSRPVFGDDAAIATPRDLASDQLTTEEITNAVNAFNDVFEQADVSVRYRIDDTTNDLVISLVDSESSEVIRQIPPESILKMRQRLEDLLGLIFDATA